MKQLIRETEVLVYAIGIDSRAEPAQCDVRRSSQGSSRSSAAEPPRPCPMPFPFPIPGGRRPAAAARRSRRRPARAGGGGSTPRSGGGDDDRVNVAALRDITDDSGGRTEIVRWRARSRSRRPPASPTS